MLHRTTIVATVWMVVLLLGIPSAVASPFPSQEPVEPYADELAAYSQEAIDRTVALGASTIVMVSTVVEAAPGGTVSTGAVEDFFRDEVGPGGATIVNTTGDAGIATVNSSRQMVDISRAYGIYLSELANERLNLAGSPPVMESSRPPCEGGSIGDLNAALARLPAGAELTICPGTYEGDLHIQTEFATVRSAQGPWATMIRGEVVLEATGIALSGFTITDGGIRVGGDGDGYAGEIWGTLLHNNVVQANPVGVRVAHAVGTLLLGNTIRGNTVGVEVIGPTDDQEVAGGAVLVANNLERNGFATRTSGDLPAPLLSIGDHYGTTGPVVEVAPRACVGAEGQTPCRNAVGQGTIWIAPSPVRHTTT